LTYDELVRALLVALLLSGCSHSAVVVSNAHAVVVTSTAYVSGTAAAALVIGTAVIAEASGPQPVPEMAPARTVALQDCTKPVDFSAGNLRCR
jgi:hypothetical protein